MRERSEIIHDIDILLRELEASETVPNVPIPAPHYHRAGPTHGEPLPPPAAYVSWRSWLAAGCPDLTNETIMGDPST
jgi:hypothetical protein